MSTDHITVRFTLPTDFEILAQMADEERYTSKHLGDLLNLKPEYIRNRIMDLRGKGLVERVGDSQMYVITRKGLVALELRNEYAHSRTQEFDDLLARRLAEESAEEP